MCPKTETECFFLKYFQAIGSNRLPHVQATLLCIDGDCTFFLSKVLGFSKGDFPVRAEILDVPIISFLELTQSALFCFRPVLLDFKKLMNSGTFAIAVYRDFIFRTTDLVVYT